MVRSRLLDAHPEILYRFSGREAGNLAFHVGDDAQAVHERQNRLAAASGYALGALVHMRQIHSDRIVTVGRGCDYDHPPECDALVTDRPGVALMVMVADCTPLLLFDPQSRTVAAVHAGRAGALSNIAGQCVERMCREFGASAETMIAVLGPSIRVCCYEVGEEIAEEAREGGYADAVETREGKRYLNINALITRQLVEGGVDAARIEALPHCTACETQRFFSYRAEGKTGRFAGVIMLR